MLLGARSGPAGAGNGASSGLRMFRLSTASETLLLLPLARAWHAESRYSHLPFSEEKFLKQVMAALGRKDNGAVFFIVHKTSVVGVINLAVGEAWLADGGCYATCLAWFIESRIRRTLLGGKVASLLMEEAKKWAKARGATDLMVHGTHGPNGGLGRRGEPLGANIVVALDPIGRRE